ncbi:MAG: alpha-aminoadipate/glutamate carrier protein LysW/ArgW [Ignisphaera sp.]
MLYFMKLKVTVVATTRRSCYYSEAIVVRFPEVDIMVEVKCPVCGNIVSLPSDIVAGELVEHDCGVTLEVVLEEGKVKLKPFEGVGEDWGE